MVSESKEDLPPRSHRPKEEDLGFSKAVVLSKSQLKACPDLSSNTTLERLDLSNNELASTEDLVVSKGLRWLSVAHNQLSTLKNVKRLKKLKVLNASHNRLRKLKNLSKLTDLKALILNNNQLCAFEAGELPELNTLVLSHNRLENMDTSSFENLTKLSMSNNELKGFPFVKKNRKLKELRLSHNSISTIDAGISRCKKLMVLDLGNNCIEELGSLASLSRIPYLLNLNLRGNPICNLLDYEKQIQEMLPSLKVFDGKKLQGKLHTDGKKANKFDIAQEKQLKSKKSSTVSNAIAKPMAEDRTRKGGFIATHAAIAAKTASSKPMKKSKGKINESSLTVPDSLSTDIESVAPAKVKDPEGVVQDPKPKKPKRKHCSDDVHSTSHKKKKVRGDDVAMVAENITTKVETESKDIVAHSNSEVTLPKKKKKKQKENKPKADAKNALGRSGVVGIERVKKDTNNRTQLDLEVLGKGVSYGEGVLTSSW